MGRLKGPAKQAPDAVVLPAGGSPGRRESEQVANLALRRIERKLEKMENELTLSTEKDH
jgi:hypothetical protein